jgi:transposase-like protein
VILNKLLPSLNMALAPVAREAGVSAQTLYNWRSKSKESGLPLPGNTPTTEQWSADAELAVVIKMAQCLSRNSVNIAVRKAFTLSKLRIGRANA